MFTIERRIAALESSTSDYRITIVIVEDGETKADALRRVGLPPDARGIVWGTQADVML